MRVLIVNAYPVSSKRGREQYNEFRRHVTCIVRDLEKTEATRVKIIEKHRNNLDSFLYEAHSEFVDPLSITNFDQLDFVFVDGDANSSPWVPSMRKLTLLTKMCMMTGKCFFGSGIGASLLAFICATGGEQLQVINNEGKNSLLDNNIPPPFQESKRFGFTSSHDGNTSVLLDKKSGDFFVYVEREHFWAPKGNTGLVLHSSDGARSYGARPNSARAGSKDKTVVKITQPLYLAKQGEIRCCVRLEVATQHPVIAMTFPRLREIILNCKSKWDLDEKIATTGCNKYRVLIDSSRGPMLLEFGHCFGSHFVLDNEYPTTINLLRNFVMSKYSELKIHARIDRSYMSAISGSTQLKQVLAQAKCNHALTTHVTQYRLNIPSDNFSYLIAGQEGIGVGKTSPKRCRPASAGPYVLKPREAYSRRIRTSRSACPSPTGSVSSKENNDRDLLILSKSGHENEEGREIYAKSTKTASILVHEAKPPRIVRVPQKNEVDKPYCAHHRFTSMRKEEDGNGLGTGYYSVVNDAPYISAYEQEAVDRQKSKLRWIGGPFRATIGKASTQVVPEASIFIKDPFVQKNVPFFMTQRRHLILNETMRSQQQQSRGKCLHTRDKC